MLKAWILQYLSVIYLVLGHSMVCKFLHSQNVEQTSNELNAIKSIQLQIKRKRFYVGMFEWMIPS